jgi:phosphoribosylformimino-5-aminoimidazole carboxamide ribotide isomerase
MRPMTREVGFTLYPAIDVLAGSVVRLQQGDYARDTVYDRDPVAVARRFAAAGAEWIHVVDLDAARDGGAPNLEVIEAICANVTCGVQVGGGVRSVADASARLAVGARRLVIGSAAVEEPGLVDELAAVHPGAVAVGLDARGRDVAIHGWTEATGRDLLALAGRFDRPGVAALVVTEISADGMLTGPALDQLAAVLAVTTIPVIASGGVGSVEDLRALIAVRAGDRRLRGAIVGRALYQGCFTIEEGLAACSQSG